MEKKRKSTIYKRANLEIPLYIDLPQGGRKNQNKKKENVNPTWKPRGSISVNSQYHPVVAR